jgi:hypothetical protein
MTMETATETTAARSFVTASLRHFVTGLTVEADLPIDWTIERATREISQAIGLPTNDAENRPTFYELFRQHDDGPGEKLPPAGTVGELVQEGDEIVPLPEITPARPRRP